MRTHNGKPLCVTDDAGDAAGVPRMNNIALEMRQKCDRFWIKRGMEPKLKFKQFGRKTEGSK